MGLHDELGNLTDRLRDLGSRLRDEASRIRAGLDPSDFDATALSALMRPNLGDVPAFIQALTNRALFETQYPGIDPDIAGDIDHSGAFDLGDVRPFGAMFEPPTATAASVPEPRAALLAMVAGLWLLAIRARRQISQKQPNAPT